MGEALGDAPEAARAESLEPKAAVIDSHCHLADDAFAADAETVIDRAREAGLTRVLCILEGGNQTEEERALRLTNYWPDLRVAVGVHPHIAGQFAGRVDHVVDTVRAQIGRVTSSRAVGEIGLDYHYDHSPRDVQRDVFAAQVRLATELDLPVVIHTREADDDTISILRDEGDGRLRGVMHCFTGHAAMARRSLDLGFHLSFAGIVTFPKAADLRETARLVPTDRLLVETDAPYLAPVPHRGKRNEPAWVRGVLNTLAEVRGANPAELADQVTRNFGELFQP
jgi:TatD DNase family protein